MYHPRLSSSVFVAVGLLFAALSLLLVPPTPALAAPIVVNSPNDNVVDGDGFCTLREAVLNANNNGGASSDCAAGDGADTITFSVSGIISLSSRLNASDAAGLVISGAGQDVVLDGGDANGILGVTPLASLEVRNLVLQNGRAANGGAVDVSSGTLTVVDSIIRNNTATLVGGGIRMASATAVTVTGTTIVGNSGGQAGGGMSLEGTTIAVISNTTVSGNQATLVGAQGGGIFVGGGSQATLTNVTVAANVADNGIAGGRGGGIRNLGTVRLQNTIIANNTASLEGADCTGAITSLGNNLIGDTTACGFGDIAGDIVDVDPALAALADNGGGRQTHALLDGSPAVDVGSNAACAAAPVSGVDQRGIARPQGAACDIGAYEALQLSIADLAQAEGNAGSSAFDAAVTLSQALPAGFPDVTVDYTTAGVTAVAGSDYTAVAGTTLSFTGGGAATQDASVSVSGDTVVEPDETFTITLSNAVGAVIADGQATITITNDDVAPPVPVQPLTPITIDGIPTGYLTRTTAISPAQRLATSGGGLDLVFSGEDLALTVYTLPFGASLSPAQPPAGGTRHGAFIVEGNQPFTPPVTLEVGLPGDDGPYVVGHWDGSQWVFLHTTQGDTTVGVDITQGGLYAVFSGIPNPPPPGRFDRDISTGVTMANWNGGTIEGLRAALAEEGAQSAWVTRGGRLIGYVPGAPDFVNAAFLAAFSDGVVPQGTALLVVR